VNGALPGHWADPTWRRAIETWAAEQLAAAGRVRTGPVTQPHVRPWSSVLRIPTAAGPVWCKAARPGTAHEASLLPAFAAWDVPSVLPPIAADPERGWLLLPDGGTTLRQTRPDGTGDHDLDAWERVLTDYAGLQRRLETRADELLTLGVPDGRPATLPGTLGRLLDDDATWDRVADADRDEARRARRRLREATGWVAARVEVLGRSGIAATIQHDDLHGGNVFVGPGGYRFFDWGDAVVAHPFATLVTTLNSIAFRLGTDAEDPALRRLRGAYLDAWTDVAPRPALADALAAALDLGRIGRAAAWDRALTGLDPSAMDGHGDAPAGWLMDLADRLER
jgi:hypothetical protein